MSDFAANAIGFYLEVEDRLTPKLRAAAREYRSFTKLLDRLNTSAFRAASKGLAQLAKLADSFENMPRRAVAAYRDVRKALQKEMKPLKQEIEVSVAGAKGGRGGLARAISEVLAKAVLRLSPAAPSRKSPLFKSGSPRRAYRGEVQPPDYTGRIRGLPRFAEGGVVGGADAGEDRILAYLTKGEMVLTEKMQEGLKAIVGAIGNTVNLRGSGGGFLAGGSSEIVQAMTDFENVVRALPKMEKAAAEMRIPLQDFEDFGVAVGVVEQAVKTLTNRMVVMDTASRKKMLPTLKAMTKQLDRMKGVMEGRKGLEAIFARFMRLPAIAAVANLLGKAQEGVSAIMGVVTSGMQLPGAEEIGSFIDNLNRLPRTIRMTRDELTGLKQAGAAMAKDLGVPLDIVGEAFESLSQAGVKDVELMKRLAGAVSLLTTTTTASGDEVGKLAYKLAAVGKLTEQQIGDFFGMVSALSKHKDFSGVIDASAMIQGARESFEEMGAVIQDMTADQQKAVMDNLLSMGAAISTQFAGQGDEFMKLVATMASGTQEGMQKAATVLGMTSQEVAESLKTADGTRRVMDALLGRLANATDPMQMRALAEALGIEATNEALGRLTRNAQNIRDSLSTAGAAAYGMGKGIQAMQADVENVLTPFQKFMNEVMNRAANFQVFGVSGAEALNFLKEFNITAAYSSVMLVKEFGSALLQVGMWLGNLVVSGLRWVGVMKKVSTVAGGVGAPGVGGAGGGIAGAVTRVGDVLKGAVTAVWDALKTVLTGVWDFVVKLAKGFGEILGSIGKGVGEALRWILTGIGQGLSALAPGLVALTPAIPVMLVLSVAVVALGAALRLAAPAFEMLRDVIIYAMDRAMETFYALINLDVGKLLAVGPAMIAVGLGFSALGSGILVGSVALMAAAPGLLAFAAAVSAMRGISGSQSGGFGDVVTQLARSFDIDSRVLKRATVAALATAPFMASLVVAGGAITAAGVLATLAELGTRMSELVGLGNPLTNLAAYSGQMVSAVVSVAQAFAGIDAALLASAVVSFSAVVDFLTKYAEVAERFDSVTGSALSRAVDAVGSWVGGDQIKDWLAGAFGLSDAIGRIAYSFSQLRLEGNAPMQQARDFFEGYIRMAETAQTAMWVAGERLKPQWIEGFVATSLTLAAGLGKAAEAFGETAKNVRQKLAVQPMTSAEIATLVSVRIEGMVSSEDEGTHERLDRLIEVMQGLSEKSPVASAARRPAVPIPVGDDVAGLARG